MRVEYLFSENPNFKITEEENEDEDDFFKHKFSFNFKPDILITEYKILIKESAVDYKDVLNYSLALLNNIIERNVVLFEKVYFDYKSQILADDLFTRSSIINKLNKIEDEFTTHIINFIDFLFFIYSVSPRVNSTIKTCHILSKILCFYKLKHKSDRSKYILSKNNRHRVFKKILDESVLIISKNVLTEYSQIETLYLLTVIKELDKDFKIPEVTLFKFIGYNEEEKQIQDLHLNYFSIVVLLYYFGHSKKYKIIKSALLNYIEKYIQKIPVEKRGKSSELAHLILDLLSCPFIEDIYKIKIYSLYKNYTQLSELIHARKVIYFNLLCI